MGGRVLASGLLAFFVLSTTAAAQPSGNSSVSWVTGESVHAVGRSGNTIFLGGEFRAVAPKSHQIGAYGYFLTDRGRPACILPPINGTVHAIANDGGNGFFVGGRFDRVGDTERQNLVHIRFDCTVDPYWTATVRGTVHALAVHAFSVYVGGSFTEAGQQGGGMTARANLAVFDGYAGVLSAWNPAPNGVAHAIKVFTAFSGPTIGRRIVIGGTFTQIAGVSRQYLAELDDAGNATSFVVDADAPVLALDAPIIAASQPSHLWVGGEFTTIGGVARNRIARIALATNTVEPSFDANANAPVRAIAVAGSSLDLVTVYAGGDFTQIGGASKNYAAALSPIGVALPFNPQPDGPVLGVAVDERYAPRYVFVGGSFTQIGGAVRLHGASVNPVTGVAEAWNPSFNGTVRAMAATGPATLTRFAVGGDFDAIGAVRRSNLAAVDLDTGQLLSFAPEFDGPIHALQVQNDELYVGGTFSRIDDVAVHNLAAFTRNLTLKSWYPDVNGTVRALASSTTTVFAGGDFTAVGAVPRGRVAAIDMATGTATPWTPPDFDASVHALYYPYSFLYVGGAFTSVGGAPVPYVARLSPDTGARDATWSPAPNGEVRAICAQPSVVHIGGVFTMAGGVPRAHLAAVDDTIGNATNWQPEPNGPVYALSCFPGLYAGGAFTTIGSGSAQQIRPHLAALVPTASGPTATYASAFRARGIGIVEALFDRFDSDGLLVGAAGNGSVDDDEPPARVAFYPRHFAGTSGPPTLPTVLALGQYPSSTDVTVWLRWNPPSRGPRPTSYRIYAGSSSGGNNYVNGIEVADTDFSVVAPVGVLVYVRVHAANAAGLSGPSEELVFLTSATCTGPPNPPSAFGASVAGSRVTLTWTPSSGEFVAGYRLEAGAVRGRTDLAFPLSASTSSFSIDAPEGVYYARLRAFGLCGISLPSSELTVVTGGATPPPPPPLHLAAGVGSQGSVTISWEPPASGTALAYRLEAGTGFGLSNLFAVTTTRTLIYTAAHVPWGTYYLRVYAIGIGGTSPPSAELIFTLP